MVKRKDSDEGTFVPNITFNSLRRTSTREPSAPNSPLKYNEKVPQLPLFPSLSQFQAKSKHKRKVSGGPDLEANEKLSRRNLAAGTFANEAVMDSPTTSDDDSNSAKSPKVQSFADLRLLRSPERLVKLGWKYYFSRQFLEWLADVKIEAYGYRRLCISILFYCACSYIGMIGTNIADYRRITLIERGWPLDVVLPDIAHDFLVPGINDPTLPDKFISFAVAVTIIYMLVHPHRLGILRRFIYCHGILVLFRSLTILSTTLPDPQRKCRDPNRKPPSSVWLPYDVLASNTCGDLMFSGHTIALVLLALVWSDYGPQNTANGFNAPNGATPSLVDSHETEAKRRTVFGTIENVFRFANASIKRLNCYMVYIMWLNAFAGVVSLLAVRFHYTTDVLFAWYLAYFTWKQYGVLLIHRELRAQNPIVYYLERRTSEHDFDKVKQQLASVKSKKWFRFPPTLPN